LPTLGESVQVVVMFTGALPFATPFGGSAKFTNPGAADTVRDVVRTAFRLILAMFELSWACATDGNPAPSSSPARSAKSRATPGERARRVDSSLNVEVKFRFSALQFEVRENAYSLPSHGRC
jgi:hypothetical protein